MRECRRDACISCGNARKATLSIIGWNSLPKIPKWRNAILVKKLWCMRVDAAGQLLPVKLHEIPPNWWLLLWTWSLVANPEGCYWWSRNSPSLSLSTLSSSLQWCLLQFFCCCWLTDAGRSEADTRNVRECSIFRHICALDSCFAALDWPTVH